MCLHSENWLTQFVNLKSGEVTAGKLINSQSLMLSLLLENDNFFFLGSLGLIQVQSGLILTHQNIIPTMSLNL